MLAQRKTIEDAIRQKEEALSQILASLADQKKIMATLKSKLNKIKQDKKVNIPRSAEEDQQQIVKVDSIRLSALNSIKSVLNM